MMPSEYSTAPPRATGRGPRRSWIRPPTRLPMKIVPIANSNGSTAWVLLQPNCSCSGTLKTLHAYTAPSASWTSTAAMTIYHRPRVGPRSVACAMPGLLGGSRVSGIRSFGTPPQPLTLGNDRVLRVLGGGDTAVEDAEPGRHRRGEQRQAGQRGDHSAAPAQPGARDAERGQR